MEFQFIDKDKEALFDNLCKKVKDCLNCTRMHGSQRVLNYSSGSLNAKIMFIGEAPGRLGADSSGIPFHGDKAGHNFEELLDFVNLDRSNIFVTNAVLCNPKDENGNNSTPKKDEINNCSLFLKEQIDVINPRIVVTLGATALESSKYISKHELNLKQNVRTANNWYNRILIPLYHPGQRAMLHRSFANQRSDYQFVMEQLNRLDKNKSKKYFSVNHYIVPVIKEMFKNSNTIDYFKLHKLYYLIEYNYYVKYKERLTNAYIVRQKDGPYCTDLHIQKLKKALPGLEIHNKNGKLLLTYSFNFFETDSSLDNKSKEVIKQILNDYGNLTNEIIKTKVYLTKPMRNFLKLEESNMINQYNTPIIFI